MRCLCAWEHLELIYDRSVLFSHTALYETCKSPLANSTMAQHHDSAQPAHKSDLSNVSTKKKHRHKVLNTFCSLSNSISVSPQRLTEELKRERKREGRKRKGHRGDRMLVWGRVWRDKLGASFNVHREWVTNHHPRLRAHPSTLIIDFSVWECVWWHAFVLKVKTKTIKPKANCCLTC